MNILSYVKSSPTSPTNPTERCPTRKILRILGILSILGILGSINLTFADMDSASSTSKTSGKYTGASFFSVNLISQDNLNMNGLTRAYLTKGMPSIGVRWNWGGYGQTPSGWQFGGEGNLSGSGVSNAMNSSIGMNTSVSLFYGYGGFYFGKSFFANSSPMKLTLGTLLGFGGYGANAVAVNSGVSLGGFFIPIEPEITFSYKILKHMSVGGRITYLFPVYIGKQGFTGNHFGVKNVHLDGLSAGILFSFF